MTSLDQEITLPYFDLDDEGLSAEIFQAQRKYYKKQMRYKNL